MTSFPYNWLAPGEIRYCACGYTLIPTDQLMCAKCKYRPTLDDFLCHCGKQAVMFFVHGFRCSTHAFQKDHDESFITDNSIVVLSKRKPTTDHSEEILQCEQTHQRLHSDMMALAEKRRSEGVEPLFWMKK